ADVAVERVAQRDLTADVDSLRFETARRADHLDEAIARGEAAVAGYAARGRIAAQLAVGLELLDLRDLRARADDVEAVPRLYAEWRALAMRELGDGHPMVRKIDRELARRIRGRVVDQRGVPVEGATVTAGQNLAGDGISAAVPFPRIADAQRVA